MTKRKTQSLSTVLDADLQKLAHRLDKLGYAIVPKQPTQEMVLAGMIARGAAVSYGEMLKSAPKIVGG